MVDDPHPSDGFYRRVVCPHCGESIAVRVGVELDDVRPWQDTRERHDWRSGRTPDQIALVETAERCGLLKAFREVIEYRAKEGVSAPRIVEEFFLLFLRQMKQKRIPLFALQRFEQQFGRRPIEFWAAQGIIAVIVDSQIRAFVPQTVIAGRNVQSLSRQSATRVGGDGPALEVWMRTRFGYVPREAEMFASELRRKSIGEFAKPNM